jgi:hypothetical protein
LRLGQRQSRPWVWGWRLHLGQEIARHVDFALEPREDQGEGG